MNKGGYQITVPAAYTGVAFLFCWTYLMFYASTAGIEAAAPISLMGSSYTVSAACMAVTVLAISFSRIDRSAFLTSPAVKVSTGLVLAAGSAVLVVGGMSHDAVFLVIGGVVTGVFSGIMCLQWATAYRRVGLRVAANSFPMLMAISVGVCVTILYLPPGAVLVSTVAFPIISELMFHAVRKETWPTFEDEEAGLKDQPINFILLLLPVALFALASGFLDYSSKGSNYTFAFYAFGAFIPVVAAGIFAFKVDRESFVGIFIVPAAVLVAVCLPFLASPGNTPFSPFISIGELGIEVLLFILAVGFAQFFSLGTLKTYALAKTTNALFNALGWYVALAVNQATEQFFHSQLSLVVIFAGVEVLGICLIVAIVKAQKSLPVDGAELADAGAETVPDDTCADLGAEAYRDEPPDGLEKDVSGKDDQVPLIATADKAQEYEPPRKDESMNFEEAITQIGAEDGLSKRELEVFVLLARGYTSPRIQQELYIAAGTVNYHSRNIYAKLGVHSKQELIALVESRLQDV